ncbi:collagen alpha-6(VI) chain-like [Exaiptasia diaphana]|uniref:VWFA domain-containing protein n=1 Tax=Exaiptasia diaphana TaxID=2652724 RepID=A0A913X450_EXADI|nr:collagen alpha-6(VI) chain-like [Exaiptasia diaphana]
MGNHFLMAIALVVFVTGDVSLSQRIRPGRCALYEKQPNCPVYTWDRCSCDQDCPLNMKCCFTGCRNVCIFPDKAVTITTKADVVFVMDSSGSISKDDYRKEKEFVKQLANIFDISRNQARASVIIYDDNPKLIFSFEDELDNRNVSAAIQGLQHLKGHTRIDKALAVAENVFTDARPTVPRIAFILTDGKQTADFDAKPLDVASKPLKVIIQFHVIIEICV